jgi:hypothetical protein
MEIRLPAQNLVSVVFLPLNPVNNVSQRDIPIRLHIFRDLEPKFPRKNPKGVLYGISKTCTELQ